VLRCARDTLLRLPRLVATVILRGLRRCALWRCALRRCALRRCALRIAATEIGPVLPIGPVAATAVPATTAMHSEAILTAVTLIVTVSRILLRLPTPSDECGQAAQLLRPAFMTALAGLLIRLLLMLLRPIVHLLIARRKRLCIARQIRLLLRFARCVTWFVLAHERLGVIIVAIKALVAARLSTARTLLLRLLLVVIGILLAELFLRGGDQAEVVFGMLVVIFGRHRVARPLRIARQLDIFFRNV